MNFKNTKNKKIIFPILIFSLLFLSIPITTEAILTTTEAANTTANVTSAVLLGGIATGISAIVGSTGATAGSTGTTAANTGVLIAAEEAKAIDKKSMDIGDALAYATAKVMLRHITDRTINWINSGFEGNPLVIENLSIFSRGITDEIIGEYIMGTKLAFLCSPFSLDIKFALYHYFNPRAPSCTLSDVIGNSEDAINSLRNDWNWATWFSMTSKPDNNAYGSFMKAELAISGEIAKALKEEDQELSWGSGFRSIKKCDTVLECTPDGETCWNNTEVNCRMITPGVWVQELGGESLKFGNQTLVIADEVNEVIGAAVAYAVSEYIMGPEGLIGSTIYNEDLEDIELPGIYDDISSKIENSLENEIEYKSIKEESLMFATDCATTTATIKGNSLKIAKLRESIPLEITRSSSVITELNTLISKANSAEFLDEWTKINNNFDDIDTHNLVDISNAQIENDFLESELVISNYEGEELICIKDKDEEEE